MQIANSLLLVAGGLAVVSRDSDVTQPATKRVCRKGPSKSPARLEPPIGSFAAPYFQPAGLVSLP
jgi:hypothetical protein